MHAASTPHTRRTDSARGALLAMGGLLALVLILFASGYGYHRDELYFLVAGQHLAWGYADQGPLTPFLAWAMTAVAPGSLTVLRIPSALLAGATVVVTGLIAREFGARRRAQLIAAASMAVASITLVLGHWLSTASFDLLAWALVTWLAARAVRTGTQPLWLVAGGVAGLALLNKPLIAFLLAALGLGILLAGPRHLLRGPWVWSGLLLAVAIWSPWLAWQTVHGWPMWSISSSIADGGSASSQPRWALLPFQFLLVSPVLAPMWIAGLVTLLRRSRLRQFRLFAVAWLALVGVFLVMAGKPYYLAGMFPVLLAAGAPEVDGWLERGSQRMRRGLLAGALAASAVVSAVIALPVLPASQAGPVVTMNPDIGETIGWPALAHTVARVYHDADGNPVLFTANYGEAGALARYGPELGLPQAYSGHNGFAAWGPPPDQPGPVITVGIDPAERERYFVDCRLAARIDNPAGVDNDERGSPIHLCSGARAPWSDIWPELRRLG